MRTTLAFFMVVTLTAGTASAAPFDAATLMPAAAHADPWHVDWLTIGTEVSHTAPLRIASGVDPAQDAGQPLHAVAIEHSDAYLTRAKIHRIASWATLPLFASQLALGASIWDGDSGWKKGAHAVVGSGIVGLFAVNAVTGVWNLFGESWNDEGRGKRLLHGLLMLGAGAGFVATSLATPEGDDGGLNFVSNRDTHRNLAIVSIGAGTAGYLIMLLGNH